MPLLRVETSATSYEVVVERGALARLDALAEPVLGDRRLFVIADEVAWEHLGERLAKGLAGRPWERVPVRLGEARKNLETVAELCGTLHRLGADRSSAVAAFGGGVAGDVAGFVAASYMRGIDFIQIPTTLLAQVDASVGGKTGVNLESGKNLVGAFHQPRLVVIDPASLETLPDREYRAGVQEVVKHGIIRSRDLFSYMERQRERVQRRDPQALERMISESVRIKAEVVRADEREGGLRRILNYGHTLGHALEAETGYRLLLHGEAVGFGMIAAARLSEQCGRLAAGDRERIVRAVLAYAAGSLASLDGVDAGRVADRIGGDKKAVGGVVRFILADGIGSVSEGPVLPRGQVVAATEFALRACRDEARGAA